MLDRPDDVALMSMRRLAKAAEVHPSTMVRLAKVFKFSSYNKFREPFQQHLRIRPKGFLERARNLQARGAGGKVQELLRDVHDADVANIKEAFEANGAKKFMDCAKAITKGHRVFVVGLRSCFPVAFFFHYVYRMFRDNAVLLDGRGGTLADDLRVFNSNDVIFAVSFEPYTFETVRSVEYAKKHGGKAVVLTDSPVSPLAEIADHALIIPKDSPSFFDSVAAAMAAVEALIAIMAAEGGSPALASIEESESQLEVFDAYWHQSKKRRGKTAKNKSGRS
ncbi:MAG: MurR/RpiR family transcriptional regulator [Rhodospirillales bacterium]